MKKALLFFLALLCSGWGHVQGLPPDPTDGGWSNRACSIISGAAVNPTTAQLTVEAPHAPQAFGLELRDGSGRMLHRLPATAPDALHMLDLSGYAPGCTCCACTAPGNNKPFNQAKSLNTTKNEVFSTFSFRLAVFHFFG